MKILEGIGNTLGSFVGTAKATLQGRYTSYARICVYLNVSKALLESICLRYRVVDWLQTLDYEHIPFQCKKFHAHEHLFWECPTNKQKEPPKPQLEKDEACFEKFQEKHKAQNKIPTQPNPKGPYTNNSFDSLENLSEQEVRSPIPSVETQPGQEKNLPATFVPSSLKSSTHIGPR
jgi:hypothetical protein